MAKKKTVKRVTRKRTEADKKRHADIRTAAKKDFPPAGKLRPVRTGIGADIRRARESQELTWYALAKMAAIPNPATIRDIEYGRDVKLSSLEAIAKALGLEVCLAETS